MSVSTTDAKIVNHVDRINCCPRNSRLLWLSWSCKTKTQKKNECQTLFPEKNIFKKKRDITNNRLCLVFSFSDCPYHSAYTTNSGAGCIEELTPDEHKTDYEVKHRKALFSGSVSSPLASIEHFSPMACMLHA